MVQSIVTKEDYLKVKGIDLEQELCKIIAIADPENVASYFISDIERHMIDFLVANYRWYGTFEGIQLERFKAAVIEQIDYILNQGSVWIEENDKPMPREEYLKIQLSIRTENILRSCGMMNII